MKSEERRERIYNILKSNKEISVSALAEQFGVSAMTIRRDLNSLEHSNLVNRSYGKAHIIDIGILSLLAEIPQKPTDFRRNLLSLVILDKQA